MLNIDENEIRLFTCYSWNLVRFLNGKGIRYKITGLNSDTRKRFWVFIRNNKLNDNLSLWKTTKPEK